MLGWPFSSLPNSKATQRRASTAPAALFVHEKCWVNTFRLWFGLVAVREFNAVDLTNVKQWGLERGCWLDEPSQLVRFVLPSQVLPMSQGLSSLLNKCWSNCVWKAQYNRNAACEALQLQRRAAVQRALRALRAWSREALVGCQVNLMLVKFCQAMSSSFCMFPLTDWPTEQTHCNFSTKVSEC